MQKLPPSSAGGTLKNTPCFRLKNPKSAPFSGLRYIKGWKFQVLVPVVQKLDNAIHRIDRYLVDKCWQNKPRYPLDRIYPADSAIHLSNYPSYWSIKIVENCPNKSLTPHPPGREGTAIYGLYIYVPLWRVWFQEVYSSIGYIIRAFGSRIGYHVSQN